MGVQWQDCIFLFDLRDLWRFGSKYLPKEHTFAAFFPKMPAKLSINDVDVAGKRVFMRVDFNVPQANVFEAI